MTRGHVGPARSIAALFFRAPDPRASAALILIVSAVFGFYPYGAFSTGVFLAFAVSAIAAAELSSLGLLGLGLGRRHAYFMSLASFLAAGFIALVASPGQPFFSAAFFLAFLLSFRSAWLRAISGAGFLRSLLPAASQSILLFAWLYPLVPAGPLRLAALSFALSLAFLAFIGAVVWFAGAPLREVFGVGLFRLSYLVFSNVVSGSSEIEGIFRRNSERVMARVSVVGIRARGGMKAVLVAPFLHPGPFGKVGSADMPQALSGRLSRRFMCEVFFAKGGCTHDDNLASSTDIGKLCGKAASLVGGLRFSGRCTGFARSDCVAGFRFKGTIVGVSSAPSGDVELGAGIDFVGEMEKHAKNAVYIEAHNSFSGDSVVAAGSPAAAEITRALGRVCGALAASGEKPLSVGVARVFPGLSAGDGMGAGGVGVVLFSAGRSKFALVFVDSNNVASGVRERILSAFRGRGVHGTEVISSDSHSANTVLERENPLCARGGADVLVASCLDGLALAGADMEPCSIGAASGFVGVRVFGKGASARVFGAVNGAVFRIKAAVASFLIVLFAKFMMFTVLGLFVADVSGGF